MKLLPECSHTLNRTPNKFQYFCDRLNIALYRYYRCSFHNCQALSISLSYLSISIYLKLSYSLRDRIRADTIITFHHHHTSHHQLFKDLRVDLFSSMIHHWNHLLTPSYFCTLNMGLIEVTFHLPSQH